MKNNFEDIYKTIFRQNYANLHFYASRLVGCEEAEDVVQDVFLELWKRQNEIIIGEQIQGFLYRAVYTRCINILKHRNIENDYAAAIEAINNQRADYYLEDNNEVLQRIESQELKKEIFQAIGELPDKCQTTFKLSYLYDMKNKEIAEVLGISLRTVEAHMYKALRFLRSKLGHLVCFFLFSSLIFFSIWNKYFQDINC